MASPLEYGRRMSLAQQESIGFKAQCLQFATFGVGQSDIGIAIEQDLIRPHVDVGFAAADNGP